MTNPRTAIYARVSKANSTGQTISVDEQLSVLQDVAARHGGTVVATHTDRAIKASGKARQRPGWDALLADIRAGRVDAVALWEVSRSSRRLAEWATFRDLCVEHGVVWLLPDGVADPAGRDRLTLGVKALMAEQEVDDLSKRIRRTVAARASEGRPHGREVYGYRRIYSPATGGLVGVEKHPEEAAVIRRLVDGVLAGRGLRTLGRELDAEGVLCPSDAIAVRRGRETKGYTWTGRVIRETVTRKAYLGIREHRRGDEVAEYAAQWPAIITEDEHRRLKAILSDPARWTRTDDGGQPIVQHWLSGTLRCGKCHGPMRRYRSQGVEAYACQDSSCRGCSVNLDAAEEIVEKVILARLGQDDAADAFSPVDDTATERAEARAALAEAEAEREEAARMLEENLLSLAGYAAADKALEGRIEAARARLRAIEAPGLPQFATEALDPVAAWSDWSPSQRHEVARALFERIEVKALGRTGRPKRDQGILDATVRRLGFVRVGTVDPVWLVDEEAAAA